MSENTITQLLADADQWEEIGKVFETDADDRARQSERVAVLRAAAAELTELRECKARLDRLTTLFNAIRDREKYQWDQGDWRAVTRVSPRA